MVLNSTVNNTKNKYKIYVKGKCKGNVYAHGLEEVKGLVVSRLKYSGTDYTIEMVYELTLIDNVASLWKILPNKPGRSYKYKKVENFNRHLQQVNLNKFWVKPNELEIIVWD